MKKGSTIFLKIVVCLFGLAVLAAMLYFPQIEGRNRNSDSISLYFNDPFLAFVYLGSLPFFTGLFQVLKLLGYIEKNVIFSKNAVRSMRNIKYCALITMGFIISSAVFIRFTSEDDYAGFIALCFLATTASTIVATGAAIFEKLMSKRIK